MKTTNILVLALAVLVSGCTATGKSSGSSQTYDMANLPEYEVDNQPEAVTVNNARIPREVFTECLGGVVEVAFVIDREGKAQQIQVLHSEPGETFVNAAARAIFATEYEPMMLDGKAVVARTNRTVKFAKPPECD